MFLNILSFTGATSQISPTQDQPFTHEYLTTYNCEG